MKKYLKYILYIIVIFVIAYFIYLFFYGRYLTLRVVEEPASLYLTLPLIQYENNRFSMDRFFIGHENYHIMYRQRQDKQILFPFIDLLSQARRAWGLYQSLIGPKRYFLCVQNYPDPTLLRESDYSVGGFGLSGSKGFKYTLENEEMKKIINYFLENQDISLPQIVKVVSFQSCNDFASIKSIVELGMSHFTNEPDILKFKNEFKKQL